MTDWSKVRIILHWRMTLILIETRYGGAITVWRGAQFFAERRGAPS